MEDFDKTVNSAKAQKEDLANMSNNTIFAKNNKDENREETRLDNSQTMESRALRELVGRPKERNGIYSTIEASNSGGSQNAICSIEEREELESRGINPDWDKQKFRETLKQQAQDKDVWLDDDYLKDKTLIHDRIANGTSENDVYLNADKKTITKVNNLSYVKGEHHTHNLNAFIDRLYAHNLLFPDIPYEIEGFITNKNGQSSIVLKQPYIEAQRNATQEEINNYFQEKGFNLDGKRDWSNYHDVWNNGEYELFDARPANVLIGKDGKLYFIDTYPHSSEYLNLKNKKQKVKQEKEKENSEN